MNNKRPMDTEPLSSSASSRYPDRHHPHHCQAAHMGNRQLLGAPGIAACEPWPAARGLPVTAQQPAQSLPPGAAAKQFGAAAAAPAPAFCPPCVAAGLLPLQLLAGQLQSPTGRNTCCRHYHDVHCRAFSAHPASPHSTALWPAMQAECSCCQQGPEDCSSALCLQHLTQQYTSRLITHLPSIQSAT